MSDPLRPQKHEEDCEPNSDGATHLPLGPHDNPPVPLVRGLLLALGAALLVFALASMAFGLHRQREAFLVTSVIVVALAISNLVLVAVGLRGGPRGSGPTAGGTAARQQRRTP